MVTGIREIIFCLKIQVANLSEHLTHRFVDQIMIVNKQYIGKLLSIFRAKMFAGNLPLPRDGNPGAAVSLTITTGKGLKKPG